MRSWLYLFVCLVSLLAFSSTSSAQVDLSTCPDPVASDFDLYDGEDCEDAVGTTDDEASLFYSASCTSFINPPGVTDWVGDYGYGAVSACLSSVNGSVPDDTYVCPGAPHDITTCQVACSGTDLTDCQDERDLYLNDLAVCLDAPTQTECNDWQDTYHCDIHTCYGVNSLDDPSTNPYASMGAAVCDEFTPADETTLGYDAMAGIDLYSEEECDEIGNATEQNYCYLFQAMDDQDCVEPEVDAPAPECGVHSIELILDALELLDDMGFGNIVLTDGVKLTWKGPRFKCKYYYVIDRLTAAVEMMCMAATIGDNTFTPNFSPAGFNGGAILGEISNINGAVSNQMQSMVLETAVGGATSATEGDALKGDAISNLASTVDGMMDNIIGELPTLPTGPDREKRRKRPCREENLVNLAGFGAPY